MPLHSTLFFGRVNGGKLNLDRAEVARRLQGFPDGPVALTVEQFPELRSSRQIAYYFGVIVPMTRQGFFNAGADLSAQEVHEYLEARFLFREKPDPLNGGIVRIQLSMAKDAEHVRRVDRQTMGEFIERCIRFASEELDVIIPEPETRAA